MTGFQFKSIRNNLAFWFITLAVIPLSINGLFFYTQGSRYLKEEAIEKLTAIRDLKVRELSSWLGERLRDIKTISQDYETRSLNNELYKIGMSPLDKNISDNVRKLLNRYLKNHTDYSELFVICPDTGRIAISTDISSEGTDKSQNPFFIQSLSEDQVYIKDIYYSGTLHTHAMTLSIPIFSLERQEQNIAGILVARVDLKHSLYNLLLSRTGMGETGETLIVNQDMVAINTLRWYENAPLNLKIQSEPAREAALGNTGIVEAPDYRNVKVLAAYTYIPKANWGFVAKQDLREIYAPVRIILLQTMLIFAVSVLCVYLVARLITQKISRPVLEMKEVAEKIEKGNLSIRNTLIRKDELGHLAGSINRMADTLNSQLTVLKGASELAETMITPDQLGEFSRKLLVKLMDITESNMGAVYMLDEENGIFKNLFSIGFDTGKQESFKADNPVGELGRVLATQSISHIKNTPEDTVFRFNTFAGTVFPKELLSIPVIDNGKVEAVISLARLDGYNREALDIVHHIWISVNNAFSRLLAVEKIRQLALELEDKNQELVAQAEELTLQSQRLNDQNVELEIQSRRIEQADRLKSEFLSNMSHELRTPLNSVIALSRVLTEQSTDRLIKEEKGYLKIIERNGKKLLALINDILDLSKIEAGRADLNPEKLLLRTLIEGIAENLEPIAFEKGIELRWSVPEGFPQIESDRVRLYQILQNIIGNAVKFTDTGGVTISASKDDQRAYIEIADTGIGISREELPHIFEEFRQVDGAHSRRYEGAGLGLAISYKSARIIGGEITVESTPAKGSKFIVSIPFKWQGSEEKSDSPDYSPPAKPIPAPGPAGRGSKHAAHILLVEDNEIAALQVKNILENNGYTFYVAKNGREALSYIAHSIPDGIILDLMMPGIDGFSVLEEIRNTKSTARTPVLILTAKNLTKDDWRRLKYNRIEQLIQKGNIDRDGLLEKINIMLGIQQTSKSVIPSAKQEREHRKSPSSKPAVLIIEDDTDNLTTIRAVLGEGYRVIEAVNGEEGVRKALSDTPDLILLDIALSGMDGLEVVRRIKEGKKTAQIPVIALTAKAMKGDRKKILDAGCDDYIAKPVDVDELRDKIESRLEK